MQESAGFLGSRITGFVRARLEWFVAPLALFAAYWSVYGKYLGRGYSIATFQDNTYLLLPIFSFVSRALHDSQFPYWINTILTGLPIYNSPQFSVTYPFYFFWLGLYHGPVEALYDVHAVTLFHIGLLYLNSYAALRLLKASPAGSFVGASIVCFAVNTVNYAVWVNITAAYSWLPLVVASAQLLVEGRRFKVAVLLGAASLSLLMLASASQPMIHALYCMSVLYTFAALRHLYNRDWRRLWRATAGVLSMGVIALAIASPSVIPAVLSVGDSIRFIGNLQPVMGWDRLPFKAMPVGQGHPRELASAILPLKTSAVERIGDPYIGPIAVLFAISALLHWRHPVVPALALLGVHGLISFTGGYWGLAQLNYHLPFVGQIREAGRHLVIFVLAAGFMAGLGFDALRARVAAGHWRTGRRRPLLTVLFIAAAAITGASLARLPLAGEATRGSVLLMTAGAALLLWLSTSRVAWLRIMSLGGVVILTILSVRQATWPIPPISYGDYFARENVVSHKVLLHLSTYPDARHYRFAFEDAGLSTQFWSMNGIYYDLRTFEGYMNPLPYRQFSQVWSSRSHYYPMLGAKYFVCKPCTKPLLAEYRLAEQVEGYQVYVTDSAMSHYTIIDRVAGSYSDEADFFRISDNGFDYRSSLYVRQDELARVNAWLDAQNADAVSAHPVLKEESAALNRIRLSLHVDHRSVLVLNEYFTPDWRVWVNGEEARPFPVNLNQVGVLLDRGGSLVEFEYRPVLFIMLLKLCALTVIGLLVCVGAMFVRKRSQPVAEDACVSQ